MINDNIHVSYKFISYNTYNQLILIRAKFLLRLFRYKLFLN